MQRRIIFMLMCCAATVLLFNQYLSAQAESIMTKKIYLLEIKGAIGPATSDYFQRGLNSAQQAGAEMVVVQLDTPGGLDLAMRDMVQAIIASAVPVVTYVSPAGARAASAGTYLLYASHIAAMAPGTNLGAATPVQIGGGGGDEGAFKLDTSVPTALTQEGTPQTDGADNIETSSSANLDNEGGSEGTPPPAAAQETEQTATADDAMSRKLINDAEAYLRSLAQLRDRNEEWATAAVREGASLSYSEALDKGVIEYIAVSITELLEKLDGKTITVLGEERTLNTKGLPIERIEPDWRNKLLSVLTDPNVAYILMLLGVYGLFFELANPGSIFPGVIGGICIVLALFAFQALPINYAGIALIGLGLAFIVGEAFMPSFGILGIGGIIAFVIGSIIMMDTDVPGYTVSPSLIAGLAIASSVLLLWMLKALLRIRRRPAVTGNNRLIGQLAECVSNRDGQLKVSILGELWNAQAQGGEINPGQRVKITEVEGLLLRVEAVESS